MKRLLNFFFKFFFFIRYLTIKIFHILFDIFWSALAVSHKPSQQDLLNLILVYLKILFFSFSNFICKNYHFNNNNNFMIFILLSLSLFKSFLKKGKKKNYLFFQKNKSILLLIL